MSEYMDIYKGYSITKDNTIKQDKFYSVVNHKVLYGGSAEILKRKIDKRIKKLELEVQQ